jgi:hypothetical protein
MIILGAKMRSSQSSEQIIMRCTVKLLIEMDEAEKDDIMLDIATFHENTQHCYNRTYSSVRARLNWPTRPQIE